MLRLEPTLKFGKIERDPVVQIDDVEVAEAIRCWPADRRPMLA
ncbi:hypothetical protein LMG27177_06809 [Paraburkholderia fynbosensis]|uniref:Uncharacterized protein n=1 Tax=Paraburkholderia fynbosensis TaxID=1200993 RepID=A0A6J5GZE7_9BURK|nr:hypothetical protein LMG27177_06809 [Paraburkholderia fynbosensis]